MFIFLYIFTLLSLLPAISADTVDSRCDPEGTSREFTIFEKVVHGAAHKKCVCHVGYFGSYCQRIYRCVSGKPFSINCTHPPEAFESTTRARCAINSEREIDVCICFTGYHGNRCEQISEGNAGKIQSRVGYFKILESDQKENDSKNQGHFVFSQEKKEDRMENNFLFWVVVCIICMMLILIPINFLVIQFILKPRLKKEIKRELHRPMHLLRNKSEDSISLPPPYYENVQSNLVESLVYATEDQSYSSGSTHIYEEINSYSSADRQIYVHV